ncbi:hypothetical protein LSUE1_G002161 [Lachnellula suecica]|uniref:L-dopachrome isomerase n=1 Tax=Lachnellula suecica TaxID=602035 RepID=A0A8T9CFD5_9HELO|nr:hypothetical protein LSUE1_G002161 [Lachnellula suecica]
MPGVNTASASASPSFSYPLTNHHADKAFQPSLANKGLILHFELPSSPADSGPTMPATSPSSTFSAEERRITRQIDRGAPGDQAIFSDRKTPEQKELARRKSQYYGDVFAHREPNSSARERVSKESMVMAEVKTNVIISDEYTFITDLSYTLSTRYQRSENSIVVTLTHSACLLFAGTFDPAYTMTINALPSQLQPATNKRNSALLGKAMEESMGVAPNRGLIKFVPVPEENMATDGKTAAGEIEELDRETAANNINLNRSLSRAGAGTPKGKKRQSLRSLRNPTPAGSALPTHDEQITPPLSARQSPTVPAIPTELSPMDRKAEKVQKMGRRKSFIAAVFGKS